ncbi:uncharacterized protein V1477_016782 [Vespula maculifrons]|uniref:Uncharacterized protein n=2 Tax=Vespula TaxID=7451 RepID=A0A834K5Q1_VESVU|nr:uncharacterized protein LOC127064000 [Vespula vulgaris]KAF7400944.1 hypothetical protein HZH66_006128 [Vespula vulgaris]
MEIETINRFVKVQGRHPFHSIDPPYHDRSYDIGSLSRKQCECLISRKLSRQRENEIYLKNHPEVKAFISILLRYLLRSLPEENVQQAVGAFFNRPRYEIVMDLKKYLRETGQPIPSTETFQGKYFKEETTTTTTTTTPRTTTTTTNDSSIFSNFEEESIQQDYMPHF